MLDRTMPLAGFATTTIGDVTIAAAPPLQRLLLQGLVAEHASPALGFALPTGPMQSTTQGEVAALWLGPDEWLLLAPELPQAALATALSGTAHSLVDISHRNAALHLSGPLAAQTLNGAVPLDLTLQAFPVGMCTRTIFEKTGITLWRRSETRWHLETGRSFIPYVWKLLEAIARADNSG